MIYLTDSYTDKRSVVIKVEGTLDGESLPVLEEAYRRNFEHGKKVTIDLESVSRFDSDGRKFLIQTKGEVRYIGLPPYIQLEMGSDPDASY